MSTVDRFEQAAELPRLPSEQAAFVDELCQRWTGDNRQRMRCLAVLQLHQAGWSMRRLARLFQTGHSNCVRMAARARRGLSQTGVPPTERDARERTSSPAA